MYEKAESTTRFPVSSTLCNCQIIGRIYIALLLILSVAVVNPVTAKDNIPEPQAVELVSNELTIGENTFIADIPRGFELELLSSDLDKPRLLHFDDHRLYIGSRSGKIYYLDPPYTQAKVLVSLKGYPHSVVMLGNTLYIAKTDGIYSVALNLDESGSDEPTVSPGDVKLVVKLPGGRGHSSRTLKLGPDNRLYVSLGIAGNCSNQYLDDSYQAGKRRGGVFVVNFSDPDRAATLKPYAAGLRNPVGFAWHPLTDVMYATNNGPDHLGYHVPPEYFSRITDGSFHGMPWFQYDGEKLIRDNCIRSKPPRPIEQVALPVAIFPARNAPMDVAFLNQSASAHSLYPNDAIVALHGSWATDNGGSNGPRSTRRKPKIVRVEFKDGEAQQVHDFVTGFQLANGMRWARPAGIAVGPDGELYFSSDGGIQGLYRIRRVK